MNSPTEKTDVCLSVAIDHRIRRYFEPITCEPTEHSQHVSTLQARGRSLQRSNEEVQVTGQLAGPASQGGLVIALQQPRNNHPFEDGLDAVIKDCDTLFALRDVFLTVSCGSLDIRTDIAVIDLLPYLSGDVKEMDDASLTQAFASTTRIMGEKNPSVLLCAGRIWLPRTDKFDSIKGKACLFESIGVGKRFGDGPRTPVTARFRCAEGDMISICRVNGFHPSYALHYQPHKSLLRQLLILVATQTCVMLSGREWKEEKWMNNLRSRCKDILNASLETCSEPHSPQRFDKEPMKGKSVQSLLEYQELYASTLRGLQSIAKNLMLDPALANGADVTLHEAILHCELSITCNDTVLILRQMSRLQQMHWPNWMTLQNELALTSAAIGTRHFAKALLKLTNGENSMALTDIFNKCANSIHRLFIVTTFKTPKSNVDLMGIGDIFLKLAIEIETLLLKLSTKQEEEILSDSLAKMKLAGPSSL